MVLVGHITFDLGTSKKFCLFMNVLCVLSCCAKPDENPPNITLKKLFAPKLSSSLGIPKKSMEKIHKSFMQCMSKVAKPQKELLPNNASKKFMKKVNEANMCVVMMINKKKKKQEDDNTCLWKKTILMGEKCEPLSFSGVIFYDDKGNQISELPRSPKIASPSLFAPKRGEIMEI